MIYPNPTKGLITIKSKEMIDIKLYDLLGNIIMDVKSVQEGNLDLSEYSSGIYNIQITFKGIILSHKVIKQ